MFEPSDENYIRTPGVSRYSLAQYCDELDKMVILSNGDVVPCCIDYDASCKIGNIFESNLTEIWMGEKRNLFVESFLKKNNCFCEKCDLPSEKTGRGIGDFCGCQQRKAPKSCKNRKP